MEKLLIGLSLCTLVACGSEKENNGDDENSVFDNNSQDTDNVDGSGCPADVPEEFRYLWDCENEEGCATKLYRYGVGESFEDGTIQITEQWFAFDGPGAYCIDTFEITGNWDSREPGTFQSPTSEELFEITWTMVDNGCSEIIWSPLFADQPADDPATQTYGGFMIFDTHNSWGVRNEDYAALVISAPINAGQYVKDSNYASGTVTPTGEHEPAMEQDENGDWCCEDPLAGEFQPSEYVWANSGACLQ